MLYPVTNPVSVTEFDANMTTLSVLRRQCLPLLRSSSLTPAAVTTVTRSTHTTNVTEGQKSSIPARAESHGYSPFKVDFKENKVEWALARVDDLVNWGRKVSGIFRYNRKCFSGYSIFSC